MTHTDTLTHWEQCWYWGQPSCGLKQLWKLEHSPALYANVCVCFDETNTLWSLSGIYKCRMERKASERWGGEEFTTSRVNQLLEPADTQGQIHKEWETARGGKWWRFVFFCDNVAPEIATIVALLNAKFFAFVTCRRKNGQEHGGIKLNFSWRSHIAERMSLKPERLQDSSSNCQSVAVWFLTCMNSDSFIWKGQTPTYGSLHLKCVSVFPW